MRFGRDGGQNLPVLGHADAGAGHARQQAVVVARAAAQAMSLRVEGQAGNQPDRVHSPEIFRVFGEKLGTGLADAVVPAGQILLGVRDRHHPVAPRGRVVARHDNLSSLAQFVFDYLFNGNFIRHGRVGRQDRCLADDGKGQQALAHTLSDGRQRLLGNGGQPFPGPDPDACLVGCRRRAHQATSAATRTPPAPPSSRTQARRGRRSLILHCCASHAFHKTRPSLLFVQEPSGALAGMGLGWFFVAPPAARERPEGKPRAVRSPASEPSARQKRE